MRRLSPHRSSRSAHHSQRTAKAQLAAVAAIAAIALTACSGGGGGEIVDLGTANNSDQAPSSSSQNPALPPANEEDGDTQAVLVPVAVYEYGYDLITPITTGTYTFEVINDGTMEHDLIIEGGSATGGTSIIFPGDTDSFTITLEPGTYTIFCSIPGHRDQGMEATFTVS